MISNISELNGPYEIAISSNIHDFFPGYYDLGDANVTVNNGTVSGEDVGGISYSGQISLADGDTPNDIITGVITIDPRTGQPDALVMHYDGIPRREPVTHNVEMKLTQTGNSFRLSGKIQIDPITIDFVIRPVESSA